MQAERFGGDGKRFAIHRTESPGSLKEIKAFENRSRASNERGGMIPRDQRAVIGVGAIEECFGPDGYVRRTGQLVKEATGFREDDGARPKTANGLQISSREMRISIDRMIKRTMQFDMVKPDAFDTGNFFKTTDLLEKQ